MFVYRGTLVHLDLARSFGFIQSEGGQKIYAHITALRAVELGGAGPYFEMPKRVAPPTVGKGDQVVFTTDPDSPTRAKRWGLAAHWDGAMLALEVQQQTEREALAAETVRQVMRGSENIPAVPPTAPREPKAQRRARKAKNAYVEAHRQQRAESNEKGDEAVGVGA
ncbi:MAG: hypothetical protein V1846_01065 [Candidatus Komeilibacteria bacterium]